MAAQASWHVKLLAVNDSASFEIAYVTSATCASKAKNSTAVTLEPESSHTVRILQQTNISEGS